MTQRKGFTLVEIMIVIAIIALLAAIAIPSFQKSRMSARATACVNNLRLIDQAKQQLATASQNMVDSYTPTATDLAPYIKGMSTSGGLVCREGGTYSFNAITNNPTCSIGTTKTPNHVLVNDVN